MAGLVQTGGRIRPERVAGFNRNGWPDCSGIRILLQLSVGTMPHNKVMRAIELFGTRVAGVVRKAVGADRPVI